MQTSGPPSPGPSQATGAKVEVAQAAGQCDRAGSEPALPVAWAPQPPRLPTASSRTAGGHSPGKGRGGLAADSGGTVWESVRSLHLESVETGRTFCEASRSLWVRVGNQRCSSQRCSSLRGASVS